MKTQNISAMDLQKQIDEFQFNLDLIMVQYVFDENKSNAIKDLVISFDARISRLSLDFTVANANNQTLDVIEMRHKYDAHKQALIQFIKDIDTTTTSTDKHNDNDDVQYEDKSISELIDIMWTHLNDSNETVIEQKVDDEAAAATQSDASPISKALNQLNADDEDLYESSDQYKSKPATMKSIPTFIKQSLDPVFVERTNSENSLAKEIQRLQGENEFYKAQNAQYLKEKSGSKAMHQRLDKVDVEQELRDRDAVIESLKAQILSDKAKSDVADAQNMENIKNLEDENEKSNNERDNLRKQLNETQENIQSEFDELKREYAAQTKILAESKIEQDADKENMQTIKDLKETILKLKKELSEAHDIINTKTDTIKELETKYIGEKVQTQYKTEEIADLNERIKEMRETPKNSITEIIEWMQSDISMDEVRPTTAIDIFTATSMLKENIKKLVNENKGLKADIDEFMKFKSVQRISTCMQTEVNENVRKINVYTQTYKEMKGMHHHFRISDIPSEQFTNEEVEQMKDTIHRYSATIKKDEEEIRRLQMKLDILWDEEIALKDELKAKQEHIVELEEKMAAVQSENKQISELVQVKAENERLSEELEVQKTSVHDLQHEVDLLRKQNEDSSHSPVIEKVTIHETVPTSIRGTEEWIVQNEELKTECQDLQKRLQEHMDSNKADSDGINEWKTKYDALLVQMDTIKQQIVFYKEKCTDLENENEELLISETQIAEEMMINDEKMKQDLISSNEDIETIERVLLMCEKDLKAKDAVIKILREQVLSDKAEIDVADAQNTRNTKDLEDENERLNNECDDLQKQLDESRESVKKFYSELQAEYDGLTKDYKTQTMILNATKSELDANKENMQNLCKDYKS